MTEPVTPTSEAEAELFALFNVQRERTRQFVRDCFAIFGQAPESDAQVERICESIETAIGVP